MDATQENVLFLQAIMEHLDELQEAMGGAWPAFQDRLRDLLDRLKEAASVHEANALVDDLIVLLLDSPAAGLTAASSSRPRRSPRPPGGVRAWKPTRSGSGARKRPRPPPLR